MSEYITDSKIQAKLVDIRRGDHQLQLLDMSDQDVIELTLDLYYELENPHELLD